MLYTEIRALTEAQSLPEQMSCAMMNTAQEFVLMFRRLLISQYN